MRATAADFQLVASTAPVTECRRYSTLLAPDNSTAFVVSPSCKPKALATEPRTVSFYLPVFPYLFLFHVFLVGINGTLIITYIHEKLIKQDHLRTSLVSSFYSLQALASSLLLTVNGYLSDLIGISKTWLAFTLISMLVFLALRGLTARKEESQA